MRPDTPRVLILSDGLYGGGTERQIVELLRGMRRSGSFRMALAVLDHGGELEAQAAELAEIVLPLRRRGRLDATTLPALLAALRVAPVGLIHAFGWMSGLLGLAAARILGVPIINGTIRGTPPRLRPHERVTRWCALGSDAVVANSEAGLAAYGLSGNPRARVIWNGMDWRRFEQVTPRALAQPAICMVGNFTEYKDQPALIRALPAVLREFPAAQLVLVGKDGGSMDRCARLAGALGIGGQVAFVTDTLDPLPIVAGSTVCVLTSTQGEGISNALIEYMALGKPVVATNEGGNRQVVQHGETGFLVPSADPDVLAQRLTELLRHPQCARRMGELGRQRARDAFSAERLVAEYSELYQACLRN